jgi:hypothetical protein
MTFRNVAINQPIDPAVFDRDLPEGVAVSDLRNGTMYLWGKGKPASDPMPLPKPAPVAVETSSRASRPVVLILANLALFVVLGFVWAYFRRKNLGPAGVPGAEP